MYYKLSYKKYHGYKTQITKRYNRLADNNASNDI